MLSRPDDFDAAAGPAPAERVLAVSEFARSVRGLVERGFPAVLVRGEISNFTRAPSGHLYFALKDASAQVRCVMWRGRAALLQWRPGDGDAVEVRAAASFYEARGEFQLTVESVRRAGAGALFEAFLRLKDKLAREGLFDAARKRPLPEFPRAIGVVTSTAAAALHDVLTTLGRRAPMVPVVIYPAPVQGDGAAARLAQAVATASARAEVDVLIVCRGGGSIEDLWSFNDEGLARAIAACRMPVVAGVGHETDFTIADFAADVRAATPTAAAEAASPARDVLTARLAAVARGLARSVRDGLARRRQRLDYAVRDLQAPAERLAAARRRLAGAAAALATTGAAGPARARARLALARARMRAPEPAPARARLTMLEARRGRAMRVFLEGLRRRLAGADLALAHLDPMRVLARGYAVVRDAAGRPVRDASALAAGDPLEITFASGGARARVEKPY